MTAFSTGRPLRILLINWQDRLNPEAGGAEVHLHEVFGRLAARGHDVRAVVGGWAGAPSKASLDGIAITRVGSRHTFPLRVRRAVGRALVDRPADVVIEDINKVPLYTPRWVASPVVALVPHLFGATAFREASWPLATLVWASERLIPAAYQQTPFQVISEGTADDLVARGIPRERIAIISPGIDHSVFRPTRTGEREATPTILYVGRLKKYKGLEVVLEALAKLDVGMSPVRLDVAGRGDDQARLARLARDLGLESRVRFLGWISEEEKVRRLQRAWVTVYPSPKEGWGIVNVEAAACGTPVVASDSPGLRESVKAGLSGYLVPHEDVGAWVAALAPLIADHAAADQMREGCIGHAAGFPWDRAARETEEHLGSVLAVSASTRKESPNV
ncbi:MAG: glycosyltransferase family 4 protein [Gemmatimonadota bacterium]